MANCCRNLLNTSRHLICRCLLVQSGHAAQQQSTRREALPRALSGQQMAEVACTKQLCACKKWQFNEFSDLGSVSACVIVSFVIYNRKGSFLRAFGCFVVNRCLLISRVQQGRVRRRQTQFKITAHRRAYEMLFPRGIWASGKSSRPPVEFFTCMRYVLFTA